MFRKMFMVPLLGMLLFSWCKAQSLAAEYLSVDFAEIAGLENTVPSSRVCHEFFATLDAAGVSLPEFREGKYWIENHIQEALRLIQSGDPNELQVLHFLPGTYVLQQQINFNAKASEFDNVVIKGAGAAFTHFEWRGSARDCFNVTGAWRGAAVPVRGYLGEKFVLANFPAGFLEEGDRLMVLSESIDRYVEGNHTGQMVRLMRISGDSLFFSHPLRADYAGEQASIRAVKARQNIGFECFSIDGSQNPTAEAMNQSAHFRFEFAANGWVRGIVSSAPIFQHVVLDRASNIEVSGNYFHEASVYTGDCGGCGYGLNLQNATGECLIVNNIFRRLRHAVLLQFGANGNAVAYNYSLDAAPGGDIQADDFLFHGAWPFRNLMEGNWVEEIRFDRRREWNGDYNIVFRNKVGRRGISTANKNDFVAVVGNVTDGCVDFSGPNNDSNISYDNAQGGFLCKNEHGMDGDAAPIGDSYLFAARPTWFPSGQGNWPPIDPVTGASNIPARWRWQQGTEKTYSVSCHECQPFSAAADLFQCVQDDGLQIPGEVRLRILGGTPPYRIAWAASPGTTLEADSATAHFSGQGRIFASVEDAAGRPPIFLEVEAGPCQAPFQAILVDSSISEGRGSSARILPNPMRELGHLEFELVVDGELNAAVYDVLGHRLAWISEGEYFAAGKYRLPIPAWKLGSGMYICRLELGDERLALRMIVR